MNLTSSPAFRGTRPRVHREEARRSFASRPASQLQAMQLCPLMAWLSSGVARDDIDASHRGFQSLDTRNRHQKTRTYVYTHLYICVCVCVCACVRVYFCTNIQACMHAYMHACIHTYIHTYIITYHTYHIHLYVYMCVYLYM